MQNIKEFIIEMLSSDSTISSMRVMAFISLFSGIGIAFIGLYRGSDLSQLSVLSGVFIGSAFAGKVVQKISEITGDKNKSNE